MTLELIVTLAAAFLSVALIVGWATSALLSAQSPERRRLRNLAPAGGPDLGLTSLVDSMDNVDPRLRRLPGFLPKSPKDMTRLRRRLGRAGYHSPTAVVVYGAATLLTPVLFGLTALFLFGTGIGGLLGIAFAVIIGYMLPGIVLARQIDNRKLQIANGLPDALDLLIVCVEAGCGLDQAIVKVTDELQLTYPALAEELRMVTTEVRAGKPRLEAFKNFAERTKVDDVRSLVALLIQTDKFGTSIAQALRTHAETSRTKRRQRAEERAAKVGVKLVFPLVLFLFPALYVVILGPAVIQFLRVFRPMAQ
ncbi:MAG TPA: type II secretion system F family protein [Vicinamibacterales bacterium]|nr:type II secretion system F family protein [Vicinamibacterales bacterium]